MPVSRQLQGTQQVMGVLALQKSSDLPCEFSCDLHVISIGSPDCNQILGGNFKNRVPGEAELFGRFGLVAQCLGKLSLYSWDNVATKVRNSSVCVCVCVCVGRQPLSLFIPKYTTILFCSWDGILEAAMCRAWHQPR